MQQAMDFNLPAKLTNWDTSPEATHYTLNLSTTFHHSFKVFHVLHSNTEPNGAGVGRSIGHDTMLIHWSLVTQLQLGDLDYGRSGDRAYNKAEMLYEMVHRFPYGCVSSTVRDGMGTRLLLAVQF